MGEPARKLNYPRYCSLDEYFKLADGSLDKLEYRGILGFPLRGEIVAMAGGTEFHGLIVANVGGELRDRLRGKPCRFYASDFRVGVRHYPTFTYTDGFVICGPTQFDDRDPTHQTAMNPTLIVEVLSPSTEAYDRGEKFGRYMHAESLQEYVLVSQHQARVEVFFRQAGGTWLLTPYVGIDSVAALRSIDVELPLAEIYLNVNFPAQRDEPSNFPEAAADKPVQQS
jgi:Uma2 family endonuclease